MFLKVVYYDEKGSKGGSSRYIYRHPDSYTLDRWSADNGALLVQASNDGYRKIVEVMIKDSSRSASGWVGRPARLKAPFIGTVDRLEMNGEILEETANWIVFNTEGGGIVYGINILPRELVQELPRK